LKPRRAARTESEARIANTVRSALAHILIERDGPALEPGPRSYRRTWIRDGALMSSALLRLGHEDVVKEFLRWYAQRQFDSGKVPCCVDARGADPVAENDSHGELIYLAAEGRNAIRTIAPCSRRCGRASRPL